MDPSLFLILLSFVCALVSSSVGLGSGLVFLGIGALFFDVKILIFYAQFYFIAVTASKALQFWSHTNWHISKLNMLGAIPFSILGSFLLLQIDSVWPTKILGVLVIVYVINVWLDLTKNLKVSDKGIVFVSMGSGFAGGFVGESTAIKGPLFDHLGLRKEVFIATAAITNLIGNLIKLPIYWQLPVDFFANIWTIVGMVGVTIVGVWIGKNLLKRMTPEFSRKLVLGMMFVVGMNLILF